MKYQLIFVVVFLILESTNSIILPNQTTLHPLWPVPFYYQAGNQSNLTLTNPCSMQYILTSQNMIPQIQEMISVYQDYMFPYCNNSNVSVRAEDITLEVNTASTVFINVANTSNILVDFSTDESYNISVTSQSMTLSSNSFAGFLRALETFSQLIFYQNTTLTTQTIAYIPFLPVTIQDHPRFSYRGLMIDSGRHFINKYNMFAIIDGMLATKLNTLHWHITDADSFPIQSLSHPNLTKYGAFSQYQTYNQSDVAEIVNYAISRGIRIVPEIDAPSHVTSWAGAPETSGLTNCTNVTNYHGIPLGQLNPIFNSTYSLLGDLYSDLATYFPWDLVHMGGDNISDWCWNNTQIIEFMNTNNIPNFEGLANYYIKMQKQVKNPTKTGIYWSERSNNFTTYGTDDILQYYDKTLKLSAQMKTYPNNKFIISAFDGFFLDCGNGSPYGQNSSCGEYVNWGIVYQWDPIAYLDSASLNNVLGGEVCLRNYITNDNNIQNHIFVRAAAFGERFWSPFNNSFNNSYSMFSRLNSWKNRVRARGVKSQPVGSGYCEKYPYVCFENVEFSIHNLFD